MRVNVLKRRRETMDWFERNLGGTAEHYLATSRERLRIPGGHAASVWLYLFSAAPGGRGTEAHLSVRYDVSFSFLRSLYHNLPPTHVAWLVCRVNSRLSGGMKKRDKG